MLSTLPHKNDTLNLKKSFTVSLQEYVKKQGFPKKIEASIIDNRFIENNPVYYTYYPHLFNEAFEVHDANILEVLSLAGFFYYKAIINIDSIFDENGSSESFDKYIVANICQEETIKLLSQLFPNGHSFWEMWNKRKMEYITAFSMDKNPRSITNYTDYEVLADFKCAFGKIAIDSLFLLSPNSDEKLYQSILCSHKNFYTAFQIIDDIRDFEEDLNNKQFNLLYFELSKTYSHRNIENEPAKELKKKLFLDGTIGKVYELALGYTKRAAASKSNKSMDQWHHEIQKLHNNVLSHQLNVNGYISVFKTRNDLSYEKVASGNTIEHSIKRGAEFIVNQQKENGSWEDYFNEAGLSNTWATAFILTHFPEALKEKYSSAVKSGLSFIESSLNEDTLLGYNDCWIPDADSTSFGILSLLQSDRQIPKEMIDNWLKFQNRNGGFSTYNNKDQVISSLNNDKITNVVGWTSSHICVSATAYYALIKAGITEEPFFKLRNYLLENLKNESQHYSYWWTDFIYTLTFITKGAEINGDQDLLEHCYRLIKKRLTETEILDTDNHFYIGLLLDCVCGSEYLYEHHHQAAYKITDTLICSQLTDGSWEENYSMRIPAPGEKEPNGKSINWTKSDKGTNIILRDYHRLFTSCISLAGLHQFHQRSQLSKKAREISILS